MNYYIYRPDADTFSGIVIPAEFDALSLHYGDGAIKNKWETIPVHRFDDTPGDEGDFPSLSNYWTIPVMSEKAWETLQPLIGRTCEALPVLHPSKRRFVIVHIIGTDDCVDLERSEVKRFTSGGIMRIIHYSLKHDCLHGKHIYKLPRDGGREVLVDDVFRHAVESNGLKGLIFKDLPLVDGTTSAS